MIIFSGFRKTALTICYIILMVFCGSIISLETLNARSQTNKNSNSLSQRSKYIKKTLPDNMSSGINKENSSMQIDTRNPESENAPFVQTKTKIQDEKVAGIRIKGKHIIYLSYNNTFYLETLNDKEDFSSVNFFKRFKKLLSVEFNSLILSNDALKNIQKFLQNDIMNIVIDSCELEENGEKLVADIIEKRKNLRSITVKLIKSTVEDVKVITSAMSNFEKLYHIVIAFREISEDSCFHLASLVEKCKNLKTLSITSGKVIDGENGFASLINTVSELSNLTTLEISFLFISEQSSKLLFSKIGSLKTLVNFKLLLGNLSDQKEIVLFENGEILKNSLANFVKLKNLNISGMKLPNDVMQLIAQSISYMPELESLNISNNSVDKECCAILAESFKKTDNLQFLIMRNCSIDSTAFPEIARSISTLPMMTICVGNNKLKDSIKSLQIKSMAELRFLDIANNGITFDLFMDFLKEIVGHSNLKMLDIKNNAEMYENDNINAIITKRDKIEKFKMDNNIDTAIFGI